MRKALVLFGTLVLALGTLVGMAGSATAKKPAPKPTIERYVALGDSYTAAPLVPVTDPAGGCYRSNSNYPTLVSKALNVKTFVDVSCSGAQTNDFTSSQYPGVAPQLDAVTADTDLVSVSIGGNDFNVFGTLVGVCPTMMATDPQGSPCRDAMRADGRDRLRADVHKTGERVLAMVREIKKRAPRAQVVVVGYPQIAPSRGTCQATLPLATGDYRYAVQINKALTMTLQQAAKRTKSSYVDLWRASKGHDICAADPWINGAVTDPTRAQNFHPFANEQAAAARLVLAQL